MRQTWIATILAGAAMLAASGAAWGYDPPASVRMKYNFNPGWKLSMGETAGAESPAFDDSAWKAITTPRAFNEDDAFKKDIHDLTTGVAWYRKRFKLPAADAGRKVFLEFEGLRQAGEFYLNGQWVGRHENGVTACGLDVTSLVKFGDQENVLAVRIDNRWDYREKATNSPFQWNDRNFNANYGGINKNVYLHVADKLYQTLPLYSNLGTTGVYVYADEFDIAGGSARVAAETQVKNEYPTARTFSYEVVLEDMEGKTVGTIDGGQSTLEPGQTRTLSAARRMEGLHFWSWGYGYLYNVYTILKVDGKVVDVVRTRTGFRKTTFSNGMVKLNDRTIQFKGYAQRTTNEWPAIGLSVPPWMSDLSNGLMVESNGNLVRWMHVTPAKQDVESCDRVGLIEAMPAGDSENDTSGRRWDQRTEVMRDAIIYNRNNPSILFYESGNKGISEPHMAQMKAIRDQYDPHGGRAAGCREMLDSKIAEYGGEMLYINKSARIPMWAMEYSRDEGPRKFWDEFTPPYHKVPVTNTYQKPAAGQKQWDLPPAFEYNRNQDSHAIEDVVRWYDYWRERPGTGTRVSSGGVNIIFSDSNTHYRGVEGYRRSGEVDAMRIPKDGYFAHQVMWDGWVDVEKPRAHILGHWNYEPGVTKNIYVVSSAEKVELLLNGSSKGFGEQSSRFLYTFKNVAWTPGTLKAVGYDATGKVICEAEKKTAGAPAGLRLTVQTGPQGLQADGADLALVQVEVVDAQGQRCPTALNMVNFSLNGPAEWRGGIAQGPGNYVLAKQLPVECGVNRVLVRSWPEPGTITLNAASDGLKAASVEIVSKAVTAKDGLSLAMPDAGLHSRLDRGPTPKGESFAVSRRPVKIVSATAGVNADKAAASFDDDEESQWTNDGKMATAWIEYTLERSTILSEITLKPGSWRNRVYPVRITLDGQEIFRGEIPRSLGYITLPLKPATGKTLKIALISQGKAEDAFGNIVEVTGQKLEENVPTKDRGTLMIVEIEAYEKTARP